VTEAELLIGFYLLFIDWPSKGYSVTYLIMQAIFFARTDLYSSALWRKGSKKKLFSLLLFIH